MRAKWSSLWRSFRMASKASLVCKSDRTHARRWCTWYITGASCTPFVFWFFFYLFDLLSAHWATSVDDKHHILRDPRQVVWSEEVHKIAVDNLKGNTWLETENMLQVQCNDGLRTTGKCQALSDAHVKAVDHQHLCSGKEGKSDFFYSDILLLLLLLSLSMLSCTCSIKLQN